MRGIGQVKSWWMPSKEERRARLRKPSRRARAAA